MTVFWTSSGTSAVALLAEGVNRNHAFFPPCGGMSPSSRRAWIEIISRIPPDLWRVVALLAEGVDRNKNYHL